MIFLSIFLMAGREYGTASKLYAIPALITVSTMLICCLIVAGHFVNCLHWFSTLLVVMCVWSFHFNEGTSWMPRYIYGSFWCRTGIDWFL